MKKQKRLTHDEKVIKCEEFIKNFEESKKKKQKNIKQKSKLEKILKG